MIPLMVAAGLSVLGAARLPSALALAGSSAVFFGSHNITVLWGSTILALTTFAIVVCVPRAREQITRAGTMRVAGLVVPALLVNAWFLLPAIAYQSQTVIGDGSTNARELLQTTMPLVSASHLFTLSRASASAGAAFALSLPILAIAWVLLGMALVLPRAAHSTWMRVLLVLVSLAVLIGVLMTHIGLLLALPRLYIELQFSYRLETYLLLALSGAMLAVLVLAKAPTRRMRLWMWALPAVLLVSAIGAAQQVAAYPQADQRASALSTYLKPPPTIEGLTDYLDIDLPRLADPNGQPPRVEFPARALRGDAVSEIVHLHPGQLVYSNLAGGPDLVHITGAKIVGIESEGNDVLEIGPVPTAAPTGPVPTIAPTARQGRRAPVQSIAVSPAESLPIVLGRLISLIAIAVLAIELVLLARHRTRVGGPMRDRRSSRARSDAV
jgi:hypothetical protein